MGLRSITCKVFVPCDAFTRDKSQYFAQIYRHYPTVISLGPNVKIKGLPDNGC